MQDEVVERLDVIDRELVTLSGLAAQQPQEVTGVYVTSVNRWLVELNDILKMYALDGPVQLVDKKQKGGPLAASIIGQASEATHLIGAIKERRTQAFEELREWEKLGRAVVKQVLGHTTFQSSADLRSKVFDALRKLEISIQ